MATTLDYAFAYAENGFPVFPLSGKSPLKDSHGCLDGTTEPAGVRELFEAHRGNIGARIPDGCVVFDVDPRNGGDLARLEARYGALPATPTVISGRRDGGCHVFLRLPEGQRVSPHGTKLLDEPGVDVLHGNKYTVLPPSTHPETGKPYIWQGSPTAEFAEVPEAVMTVIGITDDDLLAEITEKRGRQHASGYEAEAFDARTTWTELLEQDGWSLLRRSGDIEYWCRPGKKTGISGSVGYGGYDLLYVWSESIPGLESGRAYTRYEYNEAMIKEEC